MRCPTLTQLPPAPPNRSGWPWTAGTSPLPEAMPGGRPWPRLSVVTPSYNQGRFLEETIRSVLLQGYPDLEYIVIDGGSTDGSADIIRRYEPWLACWVSEPDRGQSHAINKGLQRATGQVLAYLNSDDCYLPGALAQAVRALQRHPDADVVYAESLIVAESGEMLCRTQTGELSLAALAEGLWPSQPSCLWRRQLWEQAGPLDEHLHHAMDYAFWLRAALGGARFLRLEAAWSRARLGPYSKTGGQALAGARERLALMQQMASRYSRRYATPDNWACGLAAASLWVAQELLKMQQPEQAAPHLREALQVAPEWVAQRRQPIAAEMARLLVTADAAHAMQNAHSIAQQIAAGLPVGAALARDMEAWLHVRLTSYSRQGQGAVQSQGHVLRALALRPSLLADRHVRYLVRSSLLRLSGRGS